MKTTDILVAGAGPVGLALALQAHDHGARVRIVDRREDAFRHSRALIVHPRTLEVLRPLGVSEAILARADTELAVNLHVGARTVAARLGKLPMPDTPFPHLTLVRQMDVERILTAALHERGVSVERSTNVAGLAQHTDVIEATLDTPAGPERAPAAYVVGCDGPDSLVRRTARIAWPGGPYRQEIVLADLDLDAGLDPRATHAMVGRRGMVLLFALGEQAPWRLLATRPAGPFDIPFGQPGPPVPEEELEALLQEAGFHLRITNVAWSARYRVQHRLADRFRDGRLFLAGDAAHAYSPATGQGMNTGIQDALNLGWKLAFAAQSGDQEWLLDSYEQERRPVIRRALAMTHLAFWAESSPTGVPSFARGSIAPMFAPAVPFLLRRKRMIALVERHMSQLDMAYRGSPISFTGDRAGARGPRPGHRLPDADVTSNGRLTRLHDLIARPGIHLITHRNAEPIVPAKDAHQLFVHHLTDAPGAGVTAIHPDGYVGFRSATIDLASLNAWLNRIGVGQVDRAPNSLP